MEKEINTIQKFYQTEKALVTSPFIDQTGKFNRELMATVFNRLGIKTDKKTVADVGCGTGLLARYFVSDNFYIGLDLVRHETLPALGDRQHTFIQADAQCNPLQAQSVDFLLCLDSFEHYPDQVKAAREFFRVLRPGGYMFLSIPTYANVAGIVKRTLEESGSYARNSWAPFDYWKPEALEHYITPRKIRNIFRTAGFKEFSMIGYDREVVVGLFPWIWHPNCPRLAAAIISRFFRVIAGPLVRIHPAASLHTFWKIVK
ncbi:MAG TPA: class I SAM-dependent methyltransferase [bacterium]|nr:class I SAM-dependent methyltransferase [bacterium]HPN44937.1 class I SAM-dependent methyltransferase [bacterium]